MFASMREYKFRGKSKQTGNWAYGHYTQGTENYHYITTPDGLITCIHSDTVGQFTGLYENSQEQVELNRPIFEGDIIEFILGDRLAVEWNDDTCQFQYSDGSPINDGERYGCHRHIVGDIYDNPELLTK